MKSRYLQPVSLWSHSGLLHRNGKQQKVIVQRKTCPERREATGRTHLMSPSLLSFVVLGHKFS